MDHEPYTSAFEQHKNGTVTCFLNFSGHQINGTFPSREEAEKSLQKAIKSYHRIAKEMEIKVREIKLENSPAGNDSHVSIKKDYGSMRMMEKQEEESPSPLYCIEPHGPDGQLALYVGRSRRMHGFRIANISDIDQRLWPALQEKILDVLNKKE